MRATLALAAALAFIGGCRKDLELLPTVGDAGASAKDGGGGCNGLGESVRLQNSTSSQCASSLAAAAHRFALCSCTALTVANPMSSDAFDSTGLTMGGQTTAAVGGNAGLTTNNAADLMLGGALHIGGGDVSIGGPVQVAESLRVGGVLGAASAVTVGTDAFVAGDVSGSVTVTGTLHVPTTAVVASTVMAGGTVREPVAIAPPCPCLPTSFVDVANAVSTAAANNDNATIGLVPAALSGGSAASSLDLPCGTFFVSAISPSADLTLNVHGRSALVVMGDVTLTNRLAVQLDPGAEIDLIVGGTLSTSGGHNLGNPSAPARVRIWIGGASSVLLDGDPVVGAVLNAPRAQLSASSGVELFGSVLAQSYNLGGSTTLHYDRATLSGGLVCGTPTQPAVH